MTGNIPNDKTSAAELREAATHLARAGYTVLAESVREDADRFDPPKPTWADGTIAWITALYSHPAGFRTVAFRRDGMWRPTPNDIGGWADDDVTKVEPLRVLGDDEIAVPRRLTHGEALKCLLEHTNCSLADLVLNDIVNALKAETGDAK